MKKPIGIIAITMAASSIFFVACNKRTEEKNEVKTNNNEAMKTTTTIDKLNPQKVITQNMHDAFKGETTAHFKYAAFSKKAQEEGHLAIALLFKAASESELIHANNHKIILIRMGESIPAIEPEYRVKSTIENLKNAIEGERYEYNEMYPAFIKNANTAENYMAQISLTYAYKVELKHRDFFIEALIALESQKENTLAKIYYLCPTCGNTYATTAPSRCEISMTDSKLFISITSL